MNKWFCHLLLVGTVCAMQGKEVESQQQTSAAKQRVRYPLSDACKIPDTESILRAAVIDDLQDTVDVLEKFKAPGNKVIKTLEQLEEELYKKAGISQNKSRVDQALLYVQHLDNFHNFSKQHLLLFAEYMGVMHLHYFYDPNKVQECMEGIGFYVRDRLRDFVQSSNSMQIVLKIIDQDRYVAALKMAALVSVQNKVSVANIFRSGNCNIAYSEDIDKSGTTYTQEVYIDQDRDYAQYLDRLCIYYGK